MSGVHQRPVGGIPSSTQKHVHHWPGQEKTRPLYCVVTIRVQSGVCTKGTWSCLLADASLVPLKPVLPNDGDLVSLNAPYLQRPRELSNGQSLSREEGTGPLMCFTPFP